MGAFSGRGLIAMIRTAVQDDSVDGELDERALVEGVDHGVVMVIQQLE